LKGSGSGRLQSDTPKACPDPREAFPRRALQPESCAAGHEPCPDRADRPEGLYQVRTARPDQLIKLKDTTLDPDKAEIFLAWLADTNGRLVLPFGGEVHAIVASAPIGVSLPVRPSQSLEAKSIEKAEEGDAPDLDISAYAHDPAFTRLIEDDETDETPATDEEVENDEDES
jgi:hypothetical protein